MSEHKIALMLTVYAESESDLHEVAQIFSRQVVGFGLRGFDVNLSTVYVDSEEDI